MEQRLTHAAAGYIANRLNRNIGKSGVELQKLILGTEVLLINISKFIAIYLLAAVLGVVPQTVVVHLAFIAIKRYSFGLHALDSTVCTVMSCLMLSVVPWLLQGSGIGNVVVVVSFAVIIMCLFLYAPADTKARPLVGAKIRTRLKKRAVITGLVLMSVALLVPSQEVKLLIVIGAAYQCIAILPLTYKILKRSEQNYEKHERARGNHRESHSEGC